MQENRRQVIEFGNLGIPHLLRLVRVENGANTQATLEPHIHPDQFEICCHYDGYQHYEVEGKGFDIVSGDLFVTYPNELHSSGKSSEEKSKFFYFIFELMPDTQNFMGLDAETSDYIRDTLYSGRYRQIHAGSRFREILQRIFDLYGRQDVFCRPRIYGMLVEFFYLLTETVRKSAEAEEMSREIAEVLRLLEQCPGKKWKVSEMAEKAGVSIPHFKRKFKAETGLSPYDYLLRQKVFEAQRLLCGTGLSVTEIAGELDFSSSQHFACVFRQYTGKSPSEYRRMEEGCRKG